MDRQQQRNVAQTLIQLVKDISIYNDKGIAWMRQSSEDVKKTRAQYAERFQKIRDAIGEENLTKEAKSLFDSPHLLTDGSTAHSNQIQNLLKHNRFFVEK